MDLGLISIIHRILLVITRSDRRANTAISGMLPNERTVIWFIHVMGGRAEVVVSGNITPRQLAVLSG